MTANRSDMNDEQFEQLLNHTGQQLSYPPMRDGVQSALERIRSDQALTPKPNPNNHGVLSSPWTGPDAAPSLTVFSADDEPVRSRWREIGLLAGGIAAAAAVTLILVVVFGGYRPGGDSAGVVSGAAPAVEPVAFSDPALADSILLGRPISEVSLVVQPVNSSTGEAVPGYEPVPGFVWEAISADRSTLATIESHDRICEPISGGTACRSTADVLHIVDVPGWSARQVDLPGDSWVSGLSLSQDGQRIAISLTFQGGVNEPAPTRILLIDTVTLQTLAEREVDFRPSFIEFALGDATLVVYGQQLAADRPGVNRPDPPRLLVLDAETIEINYEFTFTDLLSGYWCESDCTMEIQEWDMVEWSPGVSLSPNGGTLVIVAADQEMLFRVDLATGDVNESDLHAGAAWYSRFTRLLVSDASAKGAADGVWRDLAWSADGSRLYLLTRHADSDAGVDQLQAIDPVTGRILAEHDVDRASSLISVVPGNDQVLVESIGLSNSTTVYDAEHLEPVTVLDGYDIAIYSTLDGQPVLLAKLESKDGDKLALLDPETYQISASWDVDAGQCYLTTDVPVCQGD